MSLLSPTCALTIPSTPSYNASEPRLSFQSVQALAYLEMIWLARIGVKLGLGTDNYFVDVDGSIVLATNLEVGVFFTIEQADRH